MQDANTDGAGNSTRVDRLTTATVIVNVSERQPKGGLDFLVMTAVGKAAPPRAKILARMTRRAIMNLIPALARTVPGKVNVRYDAPKMWGEENTKPKRKT